MVRKGKILETFSRQSLLNIAKNFEITGLTGKSKAEIIGALLGVRRVSAEAVLALFSREDLKKICRDLSLDDKGRDKRGLIGRLLGCSAPTPERTMTALMKKPTLECEALIKVEGQRHKGAEGENNPPATIASGDMTGSHRLCNIRTAFPLIPEDSLVGLLPGLSPHESIDSLMRSAARIQRSSLSRTGCSVTLQLVLGQLCQGYCWLEMKRLRPPLCRSELAPLSHG